MNISLTSQPVMIGVTALTLLVGVSGYQVMTQKSSPTSTPATIPLSSNTPTTPSTETPSMFEVPFTSNECKRSGCSNTLCIDASAPDMMSTCEWKEEYACYRRARCEKQPSGECGFTQTPDLLACLQK